MSTCALTSTRPNFWLLAYLENMIPKHTYVRSKRLLQAVSSLDCQNCGKGHMVQAAHSNWGGGKGRGIKADDNLVAALCLACHYEIDQGHRLSRQERQDLWLNAHKKTVETLIRTRQWPKEVPLPLPSSCNFEG